MNDIKHTWVNRQLCDNISVYDRGLAFGDGLFETIRVNQGQIPLLDFHLERLLKGAETLGISVDEQAVREDITLALKETASREVWRMKYILTRGCSDTGYAPSHKSIPNRIVQLQPYDAGFARLMQEQGVKTCTCNWRLSEQPDLAGLKHLNRLDQVMARQEFIDSDCFEGLMRDQRGVYIEGTMSNLFAVTMMGELITPMIDLAGVEGVMRKLVIDELCPKLERKCLEAEINRMNEFVEVFITNSLLGIVPVVAVDQKTFKVGPVTRALQNTLKENNYI